MTKIRDLINEKERIEDELAVLLGEKEKPKRGRPSKEKTDETVVSSQ
ncbi:hypothetical protein [Bradyrhizobium sp. ORS 285]|nr:hypothetical protein [Bradyrhizobium sp. ORS 285]